MTRQIDADKLEQFIEKSFPVNINSEYTEGISVGLAIALSYIKGNAEEVQDD